jgi:amino acid adenylation domain-containing protein
LTKRKAEILSYLDKDDSKKRFSPSPIIRVSRNSPLPLSFAQERLWFLEQLEPGNTGYNICRASRLRGALNFKALESSLNEIIRRHEVLRTSFEVNDGQPVQLVAPDAKLKLSISDLSTIAEADRDHEIERLVADEARRPFNLSQAPLLRAKLLRLGEADHIFVLATHHIVSDAWSMGILTRELWSLYEAYANDRPSPLQDLRIQYADFAVWQREWLQGRVLQSQLSYWKKQLDDFSILNLPTDRPRPPRQTFYGARQPITLPQPLTDAINELSHRERVTPFLMLLAAFQVLLYRYSGQEDVVLGSPIANRGRPELEPLIGFFVNTLVLRADLSGNPSFREFLLRVRDVCLDAYAHQDLPFEKLVHELHPERDQSRNPIFQVMFALQNATRQFSGIPGLRIEPIEMTTTRSPFDLSLFLREREGKYIGYIEYGTDLFDRSTIERMIGHLQTLLEGIVADPDQPISRLPLLTESERHQLLVEWNDTAADYPKDRCIHDLFEEQVEKTPDAIALGFKGKSLTYRELNRRANHLASCLLRSGVRPRELIGICVEPSLEMIVGVLGILKAGAAYVPLDPSYPIDRLTLMLKDAGVSVLLSQKNLLPTLASYVGLRVLLDDLMESETENVANPAINTKPDDPAYVIYTSGSTGIPKGVIGLHRGAVNRFSWMWNTFPFAPDEKNCTKTSISFVDSIWELFGALLQGVPTIIIPEDIVKDPEQLVRMLGDQKVSRIVLVPSLLRVLLDRIPDLRNKVPTLRIWSSSGESLPAKTVEIFKTSLPDRSLINLYGSSEASADVTYHEICADTRRSVVPIGRPISNTQTYIFDAFQQPVPIGVPGELYVGGANLARGYLNCHEATAAKFVKHPCSDDPGARLFRTGDVARYLPDGNIEYLGRSDHQVKIRGHRVELREVEVLLQQHPMVQDGVVVLEAGNEKRLIAFIVPKNTFQPSTGELRSFLSVKLPDAMIPSIFVLVDALPLTLSGKIDRLKLAERRMDSFQQSQNLEVPRTDLEELVAQIWQQELKRDGFGIHDNFFDLGGHSLLAAQIIAKLRAAVFKQIPLGLMFEHPTIAGFVEAMGRLPQVKERGDLPPIIAGSHKGALPIALSQEPFFIVDLLLGGADFMNMPYAYRLSGELNVPALEKTIQEIVYRHESLRTVFHGDEDAPVQIVRRVRKVRLSFTNLSQLSPARKEKKLQGLSKKDASTRFDLTKGPLLRTKLICLDQTEHILFVTMHHIVSDQWSMGVFRRELGTIYAAFSKGIPSPLPGLPLQFADFVLWQQEMLRQGFFNEQIDYWTRQLSAPLAKLDFQKGKKRPRKRIRFRSSRQPIKIDFDLYGAVKEFARRENCTTFMVFLTALNILLHLYTGETDIRIGTLVANRGRRGTEEVIGYFVNELILRNSVNGAMRCGELLEEVRKVCIAAYARQDLPFDYLESLLNAAQNRSAPPLCQVMFNYRNFPIPVQEFAGITVASWDGQSRAGDPGVLISSIDLMIHLRETSTKLTGAVNYKVDIFSDSAIVRLLTAFNQIVRFLVRNPQRAVTDCAAETGWYVNSSVRCAQ